MAQTLPEVTHFLCQPQSQNNYDIENLLEYAEKNSENNPAYSNEIYKKIIELEPMNFDNHYKSFVLERKFGDVETANLLLNKMYELSIYHKSAEYLALTFQSYGVFSQSMQKYELSRKFFQLALDLYKELGEPLSIIR